jgi:hypothetical protein
MRTSNGLPLVLLYFPFYGDDRPCAAVTQTLGPTAGDPGVCRQHVGDHTSLSEHVEVSSSLPRDGSVSAHQELGLCEETGQSREVG